MLKWLGILIGTLRSVCRSRRDLAFENLALRQQVAVLKRAHPRLCCSDRFPLLATTRTTVLGRGRLGLRPDAPAFPDQKGRFTRPHDEGSDRLRQDGGLDLPSTVRFRSGTRIQPLT
jgi:hypothetical protein